MKIQFIALFQNSILAGLTIIGSSIFYPLLYRQTPTLAKQPSGIITPAIQSTFSQSCQNLLTSRLFIRTELFFGLRKSANIEVTDLEFQQFLTVEVTPRFPDGLTLISGRGQFKSSNGKIIKEPANLLILIYPFDRASHSSQKIEQIRKAYKLAFQQESVLRSDEPACVSF
jgi:Protein of unknown function (DUF3574)